MTDEWPLRITLPGEPIGKGRPRVRVVQYGGKRPFPQVYTDSRTRDYEKALATVAVLAMRGRKPIEGPVFLQIDAMMAIPDSWSGRKKVEALTGSVRPIGKIDWDNIAKACCDALNKIVWLDDRQVVSAYVHKMYSDNPRVDIEVTPL